MKTTKLIFFTARSPHPLADELACQGFMIHDALSISEVLALVERHPEAQIVIAPDVEPER